MPSPEIVRDARALLTQEQADLRARIGELDQLGPGSPDYDENFADSGQVAAEQGEQQAIASSLRDQLDDVTAALAAIDDGTYGRCEVCSQPIADGRLEAVPTARRCIEHA